MNRCGQAVQCRERERKFDIYQPSQLVLPGNAF